MHADAFTLVPTQNLSATANTRAFDCGNFSAFLLQVITGTRTGTITLTPTLELQLPTGAFVTYQAAAAAIAAAGTVTYFFGPLELAADPALVTESHPLALPRTCRFTFVAGGTGSWDVTAHLIPVAVS